ncbi:MAG: hypothetical protein PHY62_11410 [Gallionella sp.]|nr:hypothetical protein [Gallionella sp.]
MKRAPIRFEFHRNQAALFAYVLLFSLNALGAEPVVSAIPQTEKSDSFDAMESPRNYLSGKITQLASDIDRFFGGDRHYQESNPSVIQVSMTRADGYGGGRNFDLAAKLNLRLPVTEGRLRLLLETDPEKNVIAGTAPPQGEAVQPNKIVAPKSVAVALRLAMKKEEQWHFSTDAGLKFPLPIQPFVRTRGSFSSQLGQWHVNAAESVYWFNKLGAGETTQLDIERVFSDALLLRASTNATWLHAKHNFDLRQDVSLYHTTSDRSALLYQASVIGVSQPKFQVTDYVLLFDYRYRMHQKWLFFEVSPQMHFPVERNHRASLALTMRLEMLFDDSR